MGETSLFICLPRLEGGTALDAPAFWAAVTAPLTPEQRTAIAHVDGPLLVVAGPGSGKTTVITYRVAYLTRVAGVDPATLLVVTFTRAAADAMKARTTAVAGPVSASRATFGTFHALAYRILRQAQPERTLTIVEEGEQIGLIRQAMRQIGLNTDDDTVLDALGEIARLRAAASPPQAFKARGMTPDDFRRLCDGYQQAKAQRGALDFDDLLHEALALLQGRPELLAAYRTRYRYVMVDECQDTNPVQWELIRLLSDPRQNLCVVGDDDQAVYGWRGASPRFLLDFPALYPEAARVTLDCNHRCPPSVVAAANQLAAHNTNRFDKAIRAAKAGKAAVATLAPADSLQEAEAIVQLIRSVGGALSDWGVIYRTNQQAHAIAQGLAREGIAYRALGGMPNLYKRWPVQDLLCYLRAAAGDLTGLEQVINRPNRYVSKAVLAEARKLTAHTRLDLLNAIPRTGLVRAWQARPLEELADHLRRVALMPAPDAIGYVRTVIGYDDYIQEYCTREGGSTEEMFGLLAEVQRMAPPVAILIYVAEVERFSALTTRRGPADGEAVTLVTCHKAKGLEFPNVVVAGAVDRLMPHRSAGDLEEERRLMYVAMTRASERLWISSPRRYEGREAQASPFVREAMNNVGVLTNDADTERRDVSRSPDAPGAFHGRVG